MHDVRGGGAGAQLAGDGGRPGRGAAVHPDRCSGYCRPHRRSRADGRLRGRVRKRRDEQLLLDPEAVQRRGEPGDLRRLASDRRGTHGPGSGTGGAPVELDRQAQDAQGRR